MILGLEYVPGFHGSHIFSRAPMEIVKKKFVLKEPGTKVTHTHTWIYMIFLECRLIDNK